MQTELTIKLSLGHGKPTVELSENEARELYAKLHALFATKDHPPVIPFTPVSPTFPTDPYFPLVTTTVTSGYVEEVSKTE